LDQKVITRRSDDEALFIKQYSELVSENYVLVKIDGPKYILVKADDKPAEKAVETPKANTSQTECLRLRLHEVRTELKTNKSLTSVARKKLRAKVAKIKAALV